MSQVKVKEIATKAVALTIASTLLTTAAFIISTLLLALLAAAL